VLPSRQSLDRYTCPESVESIRIVGTRPRTCTVNEGDEVTDNDETIVSRSTDVLEDETVEA
jgi:hypothetical protein